MNDLTRTCSEVDKNEEKSRVPPTQPHLVHDANAAMCRSINHVALRKGARS